MGVHRNKSSKAKIVQVRYELTTDILYLAIVQASNGSRPLRGNTPYSVCSRPQNGPKIYSRFQKTSA